MAVKILGYYVDPFKTVYAIYSVDGHKDMFKCTYNESIYTFLLFSAEKVFTNYAKFLNFKYETLGQ